MATLLSTEDKPRRDRRRGGDRWRSEVKGILALAVAGFGLVALAAFDPARPPTAQHSPMGPVGVWLAWAAVKSFGYGGFLFPLLLGAWGASAFVRPLVTRGWAPLAGLALLLVSATGLLTQASHTLSRGAAERQATVGGLVGWAVSTTLRAGVGAIGTCLHRFSKNLSGFFRAPDHGLGIDAGRWSFIEATAGRLAAFPEQLIHR